ncbi:MAG TPA: prepilin peptidase [Verrucomicrobiae bacterium]|nr:prepilin peptidase [Verrucomicrobiae bacterium]
MAILTNVAQALVGALVYGGAGLVGAIAAIAMLPGLKRFEDGPAPVDVSPIALVAGAAVLGAFVAWRHVPMAQLLTGAVVTIALVGLWYCDARTGIVPDVFTLVPLGLAILFAFFTQQQVPVLISSVVLFVPFALAAIFSKGRGMGWGDAKLAALAGALLGMMAATFVLGIASLIAVIVASIRYRSKPVPIAFAPYMAAAIAIGIAYKAW